LHLGPRQGQEEQRQLCSFQVDQDAGVRPQGAAARELGQGQREQLNQLILANQHARLTFAAITTKAIAKFERAKALLDFRTQHRDDLLISWLGLFSTETRFGDITGVKTAERLKDYPLPWVPTSPAWHFAGPRGSGTWRDRRSGDHVLTAAAHLTHVLRARLPAHGLLAYAAMPGRIQIFCNSRHTGTSAASSAFCERSTCAAIPPARRGSASLPPAVSVSPSRSSASPRSAHPRPGSSPCPAWAGSGSAGSVRRCPSGC